MYEVQVVQDRFILVHNYLASKNMVVIQDLYLEVLNNKNIT